MHGQWSSRWAFILAAGGSAIGLGNIWKFPYIAGVNGGGAFVLVYLLTVLAIGVPVMIAEIMLGRRGRQSPINTLRTLAKEAHVSHRWYLLGAGGIITGVLILSYYSVISGWALAYVFKAALGEFAHGDAAATHGLFVTHVSSPTQLIVWHSLIMLMTMAVVARGVRGGLERAVRWMMPGLFILLLVLVGYAMSTNGFGQALAFLFQPDFSKLSAAGVLIAMGHAFFTLSLGMGAIMMYGSYLKSHTPIVPTVVVIAGLDTLVALLAGLAIFPLVFSYGLTPGAGPGLVFETLPIAFGTMPGGAFFGTLFFLLLVFAAWTSTISLVEPAVAWLVENHDYTRRNASILTGAVIWALGLVTVLSFNVWSQAKLFGKTPFEIIDFMTANVLLPWGGLLIAVFAGWVMSPRATEAELAVPQRWLYRSWRVLVRYVAPLGILMVFFNLLGLI